MVRLDVALVARGLARSRTQAARLLAEGRVTLNGATAAKPSTPVTDADDIAAVEELPLDQLANRLGEAQGVLAGVLNNDPSVTQLGIPGVAR